ncbi:helix-turn-helix domain-containing protein, partial [Devosia nitrariae]
MGQNYQQLGLRERIEIEIWHRRGCSTQAIARHLGRSPSTISRELRRNAKRTKQWRGPYDGERAHGLARRRRWRDARFKLARRPNLRDLVRDQLAMGRSPEQI